MDRPRVCNRDGTPIDPVPPAIVILICFLTIYAWGPLYLRTLGVSLAESVLLLTAVFLVVAVGTYYQMVWTANPTCRREIPPEKRVYLFRYAFLICLGLVVLLALPLVVSP